MKRILVVGATGFLGHKIVQSLMLEKGFEIRAMSRKGPPTDAIPKVEWVRGDMMDSASLDAALQDVDVVITSANGYMKETIEADYQGNKNLIEAVARAGIDRFVFLSIVNCESASDVPHFHAKKVAEDLIKAASIPYVFIRAPAFLDQSTDHIADGVRAGRFLAIGDKTTRWSFVITDDLALCIAKAAVYHEDTINNNSIDIGWSDGAKNQTELAKIISTVPGKQLSIWTVRWGVFQILARPVKLFSALGSDLMKMFLFFKKGDFVSDITKQEKFFGPAPTSTEAVTRWVKSNKL